MVVDVGTIGVASLAFHLIVSVPASGWYSVMHSFDVAVTLPLILPDRMDTDPGPVTRATCQEGSHLHRRRRGPADEEGWFDRRGADHSVAGDRVVRDVDLLRPPDYRGERHEDGECGDSHLTLPCYRVPFESYRRPQRTRHYPWCHIAPWGECRGTCRVRT